MSIEQIAAAALAVYAADKALGWAIGLYRLATRRRREMNEHKARTAVDAAAFQEVMGAAIEKAVAAAEAKRDRAASPPTSTVKS